MYGILQTSHSHMKYIILVLFAIVLIKSLYGMLKDEKYLKIDSILSSALMGFLHLQVLFGLLLYFVFSSKGLNAFMEHGGQVMKNGELRYFAVEHILAMLIAIVIAQVGKIIVKKRLKTVASKQLFRLQFIYYFIALVIILSRIPLL